MVIFFFQRKLKLIKLTTGRCTFHISQTVEKNDGEGEKRICTLETLCTTIFQPGNNTSMTCYDAYGHTEISVCNEGVCSGNSCSSSPPPSPSLPRLTFKALNSTNRENRSSRSNLPPANTQLSER